MTNDEAIAYFKRHIDLYCVDGICREAEETAIKALEQQPSDTVSRGVFEQVMWERDVAIGQLKELGYELGQKVETCEDVIDRDFMFSVLDNFCGHDRTATITLDTLADLVYDMPPVTPQQKYGKWKVVSDGYGDNAYICECSECKDTVWVYKDADRKWNYCPSCGAKMVESQESEEV